MKHGSLILFFLVCAYCKAQVYVYEPIRHSNFETNPSVLATQKYTALAAITHQGRLPYVPQAFGDYSYDALKFTYYNKQRFYGIGLFANRSQFTNSTNALTAGLAAAYRVVVLNKYHARIGAVYKLNQFRNTGGNYSEYEFISDSLSPPINTSVSNLNTSLSFSTSRDRCFINVAALNINLGKIHNQMKNVSPKYYVLNIGDLGKLMGNTNNEINFTSIIKVSGTKRTFQQQLNVLMQAMLISRRSTLMFGFVVAYNSENYILCKPALLLYRKEIFGRLKKYRGCKPLLRDAGVFRLQYDFAVPVKHSLQPFKPSLQLSYAKIF